MAVHAIVSDFGGVLTTPLIGGFRALQERSAEITPEQFGMALAALTVARGENPLYALEAGRIGEPEFMDAVGVQLTTQLGRPTTLEGFGETFLSGLTPNHRFLDYLRSLREQHRLRLAICTNNVREWSARWQAMISAGDLFEVIVDSSEVGARKPDPRIYLETLRELGLSAEQTVFVDDLEVNVTAAAELGMRAVWFQSTEQAIAEVGAALSGER